MVQFQPNIVQSILVKMSQSFTNNDHLIIKKGMIGSLSKSTLWYTNSFEQMCLLIMVSDVTHWFLVMFCTFLTAGLSVL